MEIRRAGTSEAAALTAIAQKSKAHWGYPVAWLTQWQKLLTITPECVARNETFVAEEGDRLLAFYILCRHGAEARLEHLWVLPAEINRGYGRKLFRHAAARARALGANCLTIESDPHAESFYLHLGAVRAGTIVSEVEGEERELPLLVFSLTRKGQKQSGHPSGRKD